LAVVSSLHFFGQAKKGRINHMNNLSGKVALVTGAAKNLGRAIAINLAKQGASVAVHYHKSKKESHATLKEINKYSRGILVSGDVTLESDVATIFRTVESSLGPVDILINLVGNFIFEPISDTTFVKFQDVIGSNLYSTFLCCKRAIPPMRKIHWGRIINFGCAGADGITIRKNTTPYYVAKTGVIMLTKVLASEVAEDHVTVNTISPGILETSVAKPPTPTGRFATFEDIINSVNFLLKEESQYINGANIEVAGGWRPGYDP
jgi:3-oxoacyl-[acyl-carrier protein] reductase